MVEQDYTKEDLKKAMLNEACPNMIGFYSDMVEDFKLIDEMNYGDKAQWFYRKQGTCFEVEDPQMFQQNFDYWETQIFRSFEIIRKGKDLYSVREIHPKHS